MSISVIVSDDHPVFRRGLVDLISSDNSFEIIGEAENGIEALELIKRLKPDIAVIDLSMPGLGGLEVIKEIRKIDQRTGFVVLTVYSDTEYVDKAIDMDVKGYILKDDTESDLVTCMKAVANGGSYVSTFISQHLINKIKRIKDLENTKPSINSLTKTERIVLKLTSENKSCKETALEMNISPKTVENHRKNISSKLNLKGRNKLLQFAIEHKSSL